MKLRDRGSEQRPNLYLPSVTVHNFNQRFIKSQPWLNQSQPVSPGPEPRTCCSAIDNSMHAAWLYNCFSFSLRDVELILAARTIVVSYETVRKWGLRFGRLLANKPEAAPASSGRQDRLSALTR